MEALVAGASGGPAGYGCIAAFDVTPVPRPLHHPVASCVGFVLRKARLLLARLAKPAGGPGFLYLFKRRAVCATGAS